MKHIKAQYDGNGIVLQTAKDEAELRTAIMNELTSLVRQRKHWMLMSQSHKFSIQEAFLHLESFIRSHQNSSLSTVCAKVLQLEGKFTVILPSPTGKHSCRFENFQFIIQLCKAYTNARHHYLSGKR